PPSPSPLSLHDALPILTWDQLREMQSQGLEVGSHTLSHPILSALTPAQVEEELRASSDHIKSELGKSPLGICYPNGMAKDISPLDWKSTRLNSSHVKIS